MSKTSVVFITGASSGIGLAIARAVPFEARVFNISRRAVEGLEHMPADLSDPASWGQVAALFERELSGFEGPRAIFIHSAGTLTPMGAAGEVDGAGYTRQVLLNSAAPQVLGNAFLSAAAGCSARRQLLIVGSGAGQTVYEGWSAYCGGKAATDHWVRTVGAEQARRSGCEVASVAPGVVDTPMQDEIRATPVGDFPDHSRFVELHQEGLLRDPSEVAADFWRLLEAGLENGAVLDLREP
ncbi:SDR family NAD(P)-dependent oxidoreductase [Myxococcota bacterium]|nr:SDR family NAD(P)-dependent oxidoreductase [Myxococcota bacterium]